MSAIRGTIRDGKVVFDTPPAWPEGKEVFVVDPENAERELVLLREDEQGDDPELIERWCAWVDSLEPFILTAEDEERIRKARAEQKAFELAQWEARADNLRKLFE